VFKSSIKLVGKCAQAALMSEITAPSHFCPIEKVDLRLYMTRNLAGGEEGRVL